MSDTVEGLFDDSDDGQYSDDNQARLGTRRKNQDYSDESDNGHGYHDDEEDDYGYSEAKS
ncbi:hypothetical protein EC988_001114, partial [Linderina pennispora]